MKPSLPVGLASWLALVLVLAPAVSGASSAHADDATPWSAGVTEAQKATAKGHLDRGNALAVENKHREALAAYEQALAAYDHPAIRFNMVKMLINLDRPVEAFDNLEPALKYGAAPLGDELFADAQNYRKLLIGQIANVEIGCTQEGAAVSLDGEPFVSCPGRKRTRVRPGRHAIVASKTGFLTLSRDEPLAPGDNPAIELVLVPLEKATITRTRWAAWKPWAVVGAGVLVGSLGVVVEIDARGQFSDYERRLTLECGDLVCAEDPGQSELDRALLRDRIGISMIAVGAAAVAVGGVLLVLNRPYQVPKEQAQMGRSVTATPLIGDGVLGLALSGRL